jgi:glycosyltransferase involved in cell wall biosynthesis
MEVRSESRRSWSVVAPFFKADGSNRWIDDLVTDGSWIFRKVPLTSARDDWHSRSSRATGVTKWLQYWDQSRRAFPASGVITLFPQAALMIGVQKSLRRLDVPVVAWCFNLGDYPDGLKRAAARAALKSVDRFVVHSTGEVRRVSEFLGIPARKVEFVPLQRAPIPIEADEDVASPFVVAMGSANRDYRTFFKAAEISGLPCKVVSSPRSVDGLRIPANVSVESGLTASECHRVVQRSRFSVVPLLDPGIASGQVTVIESMRMNRPVVATRSIGTSDYIQDGQSGALVVPHDPEGLATAMLQLWDDAALRQRYARKAAEFAETTLSDGAAARALARIMSQLELER